MGTTEDAVDAAADFIGPYLDKGAKQDRGDTLAERETILDDQLVEQALFHLHAINSAEKVADPTAPYDGSLVGIVYGLLDLITSQGILLFLSPRVAFAQRPQSVLVPSLRLPPSRDENLLSRIIQSLIPIYEQDATGIQPLLTQRILPDLISAVAELSFAPYTSEQTHSAFIPLYEKILVSTPVSRLLPILTSWLQQELPPWLRQRLSKELALIPLRKHGIRHTVEFLSLSYLSKNSKVPQESSKSLSQIPIPLEAITQASRLLASAPTSMSLDRWFTQLAPQLLALLDGTEGKELARAAGQIIGAFLGRKATGAPGTIGWKLFAKPLLQAVDPEESVNPTLRQSTADQVIVDEPSLRLSLKRLSVIVSSYSHAGLIKRLVGPILLSLWGLMGYVKSRSSLEEEWTQLPRVIVSRYVTTSCDPKQIDTITMNIFWDGKPWWTFGPGSQGGVEIRRRVQKGNGTMGMEGLFSRIERMDERINTLVTLLVEANIEDEVAGTIFLRTTKRWLSLGHVTKTSKTSLTDEGDTDPVAALVDAKLSEAMATKFQQKFARSPQHIIELMGQLLQNFVTSHSSKSRGLKDADKLSRASLRNLVLEPSGQETPSSSADTESENLVSFAISILTTLIASPDFNRTSDLTKLFPPIFSSLEYLSQPHPDLAIQPFIINAARNLTHLLNPAPKTISLEDPLTHHRKTLKSALADLTSPDPPNRTWALSTLRKLIQDHTTLPLIDIPSTTHMILLASIADPESYVHSAAIPVLTDLAVLAPNPTLRILVDAFVDIDERSLRLRKEQDIAEALDFRLRVGEILNNFVLKDGFWGAADNIIVRFSSIKMIVEAMLSLASRRGQRQKTQSQRNQLANMARLEQEEGEKAWGGPIPNLLDPEGEDPVSQQERDALLKIVTGWESTGIEEDVRIRASALSILGLVMEKRLEFSSQVTVDAGLQMVLQILVMEMGEEKAILRRAAVLVIMGLLRSMDAALENGKESAVGLRNKQTEGVERVLTWIRGEDADDLVRSHAETVLEGLETWNMKRLYKLRDEGHGHGLGLNADLGLNGHLRGLIVRPAEEEDNTQRRGLIVEEIE